MLVSVAPGLPQPCACQFGQLCGTLTTVPGDRAEPITAGPQASPPDRRGDRNRNLRKCALSDDGSTHEQWIQLQEDASL
jgi:hypothetical protein